MPLFDVQPLAVRIELPPNLLIDVPSSSSRVSSASHQMRKFVCAGLVPTFALLVAENRPVTLDDHISAPGLLARDVVGDAATRVGAVDRLTPG